MKKIIFVLTILMGISQMYAQNTVDFDDLSHHSVVNDGYDGIDTWDAPSDLYALDATLGGYSSSGYGYGMTSPDMVAYNAFGDYPIEILNTESFTWEAYFTSAWNIGMIIRIEAWRSGTMLGFDNLAIDYYGPTHYVCPYEVDKIVISLNQAGSDVDSDSGNGDHLVIDDFIYTCAGHAATIKQFSGNPFDELCPDEQGVYLASASSSGPPSVYSYDWSFSNSPVTMDGAPGGGGQHATDGSPRRIGAAWANTSQTTHMESVDLTVVYDDGCEAIAPQIPVTVYDEIDPTILVQDKAFCHSDPGVTSGLAGTGVRAGHPGVTSSASDEVQIVWTLLNKPANSDLVVGTDYTTSDCGDNLEVFDDEIGMSWSGVCRVMSNDPVNNVGNPIYGTYTFEASAYNCTTGCMSDPVGPFTITVHQPPVMTCPDNIEVCIFEADFDMRTLTPAPSPAGGTFTGTGVSGNDFSPAAAGPGVHTIKYEITDGNGCYNECTFDITVFDAPGITIKQFAGNPFDELCPDEQGVYLASAPAAGPPSVGTYDWTFSGTPVIQHGAPSGGGQHATDGSPRRIGAAWANTSQATQTETVDLTVTYDNGCVVTAPQLLVSVYDEEDPSIMVQDKAFCYNDPNISPNLAGTGIRAGHPGVTSSASDDVKIVWLLTEKPANSDLVVGMEYTGTHCGDNFETFDGEISVSWSGVCKMLSVAPVNNLGDPIYGTYKFMAYAYNCTTGCSSDLVGPFTIAVFASPDITIKSFAGNPFDELCPDEQGVYLASPAAAGPPAVASYDWTFSDSPVTESGGGGGGTGQLANDGTPRRIGASWANASQTTHFETVDLMVTYENGCVETAPQLLVTVYDEIDPTIMVQDKAFCYADPTVNPGLAGTGVRAGHPGVTSSATDEVRIVWTLTGKPANSDLIMGLDYTGTHCGDNFERFDDEIAVSWSGVCRLLSNAPVNNTGDPIIGTYEFMAYAENCTTGCVSEIVGPFSISVYDHPQVTIQPFSPNINPFDEVCVGDQAVFLASASAAGTPSVGNYDWTFSGTPLTEPGGGGGGTGQLATDGTPRRIGATWSAGGFETVDLTVTYDNGCVETAPQLLVAVHETADPTIGVQNKVYTWGDPAIHPGLTGTGVKANHPGVHSNSSDEVRIIWTLLGKPADSDYNVGDEFTTPDCGEPFNNYGELAVSWAGVIRVNSNSPVNGTGDPIYGTYLFDAYAEDCVTGCFSSAIGVFSITVLDPVIPVQVFNEDEFMTSYGRPDYRTDYTLNNGNTVNLNQQSLIFNSMEIADFELYQNVPNPFMDQTVIAFRLPANTAFVLSLF